MYQRRGSMTQQQEKERRASIKAVMADPNLTPLERRRSIQLLMDGRRNSAGFNSNPDSTQVTQIICSKRMEESRPECKHYKRNCTIISPCCGAAFGCRICHDECPVLPPAKYGVSKKEQPAAGRKYHRSASLPMSFSGVAEPEHHKIDRFAIHEVICRNCFTRQSSKTNECRNCFIRFGEYHCNVCNLWMSVDDDPYHCDACGFCRIGGRENFKHCYDCGMCIDSVLYANHNCKAGKYMSCCPVCQEDLFTSRVASHEMPCGHAIHWECFKDLSTYDSRCPICKKTTETPERMSSTWKSIAISIKTQPLPAEHAKVVTISCIDCEQSSYGRGWHFLGVQCTHCSSFNTQVEQILLTGAEALTFLTASEPRYDAMDVDME